MQKASDIRCHDDPPLVSLGEGSVDLHATPKDKKQINRFGLFIIRLGCKIAGLSFSE